MAQYLRLGISWLFRWFTVIFQNLSGFCWGKPLNKWRYDGKHHICILLGWSSFFYSSHDAILFMIFNFDWGRGRFRDFHMPFPTITLIFRTYVEILSTINMSILITCSELKVDWCGPGFYLIATPLSGFHVNTKAIMKLRGRWIIMSTLTFAQWSLKPLSIPISPGCNYLSKWL